VGTNYKKEKSSIGNKNVFSFSSKIKSKKKKPFQKRQNNFGTLTLMIKILERNLNKKRQKNHFY